ncbi:cell division protein FtsX [Lachnospiraceae bacterium KM106-2]|nr:cell division protein FtsX [Lachnospiraceae bacterium KM106-2]
MINLTAVMYTIKQGFKNIKRNNLFSIASIGTITASLFLFGLFYFMVSNVQFMVKNAETNVGITVLFNEGISEDQITQIGDQIKKNSAVDKMEYTSSAEAWDKFQKDFFDGDERLAQTFGSDNPLANSASYTVYLKSISKQESVVAYIEKIDGVRQVNRSDSAAHMLTNFNKLVAYISGAIIIVLMVVAVFLISTTVSMGITVRRQEISIMKLMGATDSFVRAPFIIEGVIIGLIGAIIPLGCLYLMYHRAIEYLSTKFRILSGALVFLSSDQVFKTLVPITLAVGVGIGLIGSFVTVRKHLKI